MLAWLRRWLGILTDDELQTLEDRDLAYQRSTWPVVDRVFPLSEEEQEERPTSARDS